MRTNHYLPMRPPAVAALALLTVALSAAVAANTAIGMAVANGSFQVDHSQVWGSSSLFEGSTVETSRTASQIRLSGTVDARLAAESRVTVYRDRMVLDQGFTQIQAAPRYEVRASMLAISTEAPGSVARIKLNGEHKVTVAALGGPVAIRNLGGLLVARVEPGESLDFEPRDDGAAAPARVSGCMLEKAGKTVLADQTTNVVVELMGSDLEKEVGNRVEIVGMEAGTASTGTGAVRLIKVAGMKEIGKGGCASMAKKIGASATAASAAAAAGGSTAGGAAGAAGAGAAGAGAAAGGISVATIAVIGGVAAAATLGGLAATGSLPGQSSSGPSASR
jgi:hypothetical protein